MAKPHERVFALIGALLFFATTAAVSAVVIWQVHQQNQTDQATKKAQEAAQQAQQNPQPKEGQLQGTKLSGFTPVDHVDKLQITDLTVGTGAEVKAGDTITAHYTGALAKDGTIFQSSHDNGQPFTSALSGLVQGWQEGIPGMKVGGKRRLLIPAAQAYGNQAQSGIPANSDLVFDIELVSIP